MVFGYLKQEVYRVQFSSVTQSCPTLRPCGLQRARPPYPSPAAGVYPNPCPLSRWCHPVISSSVVPFSSCSQLSQHQGLFQWVSSLHQVKYWNFSFNISPSNEHPRLISFRVDWLDLLAVQGTIKSLLQHFSSKYQFFGTQLSLQSNPHIHTWPLEKP